MLRGNDGDDILHGKDGFDRLIGDAGADNLTGGAGIDIITGGAGADRFVFGQGSEVDVLRDFDPTVDILDLRTSSLTDFAAFQAAANAASYGVAISLSGDDFLKIKGVSEGQIGTEDVLL